MKWMSKTVIAEIGKRIIPTYKLGEPEKNPVFFEKRVYQGSNGKVYPVPFIDKVYDHIIEKEYVTATLENEYVRLVMLPEIGGRIFEAQDKTNNNYDFFYKQEVIKPALVGLAGPWISGGVEFNWPQHHRPGTYLPCDVQLEEDEDGSKTVWMSEYDPLNRLKGMHGIRLRPGCSLIELRARLYNRTPYIQTFLWWANVAVKVHDKYESFMPPDVHYMADHAVRAMSSYPLAENDYYGIPYHERQGNNDLRWYQNIPVPTSYMVCESKYNFFGGYDHAADGGFIHVANRHIAPGKKQWTWGSAEFGKAWDRELTDKGGPYFELMAGVYTDNQPDFSYLAPYETKTFSQYWYGFNKLGPVQNASKDVAIRLKLLEGNKLDLGVATSKTFNNMTIKVKIADKEVLYPDVSISPGIPWQEKSLTIETGNEDKVTLVVQNAEREVLLSSSICEVDKSRNRKLAEEPPVASEVSNTNELNLTGEHLEQYRHPTRYPESYWEKAIEKDPKDYRAFVALGKSALKRGILAEAENRFRQAINILTSYHPNPENGSAHYFCGLACMLQNKTEEAYALLYKATWNYEWRSAAYYLLASLDCRKEDFEAALEHLEASLDTNRQNNKAYILKSIIKRKLGLSNEAKEILQTLLDADPLDQWAKFELATHTDSFDAFLQSSRNDAQTIIDIAFDYAEAGFYQEGIELILLHQKHEITACAVPNPMVKSLMTSFILAWLYEKSNQNKQMEEVLKEIPTFNPDYFFPSRIQEQLVLEWAVQHCNQSCLAAYGLGNYMLDKKRYKEAIKYWELAVESNMNYATLYRNLGIIYWNSKQDGAKSRAYFEQAIELSPEDMRILFEYDQLRKKLNDSPADRFAYLEPLKKKILTRDDFTVELAALYNFIGDYKSALQLIESKKFHPWEGGEGQVLRQYSNACLRLGEIELEKGKAKAALAYFNKAENPPDNLGEKYHPLQSMANIYYWRGKALKALEKNEDANKLFMSCADESSDFVDMVISSYSEMSYYSALALNELGRVDEVNRIFEDMKTFGKRRLNEEVRIDYFATSLPLLLVFEEDLEKRNEWESKYLIALSEIGLGNVQEARALLKSVLTLTVMHYGAKSLLAKIEAI